MIQTIRQSWPPYLRDWLRPQDRKKITEALRGNPDTGKRIGLIDTVVCENIMFHIRSHVGFVRNIEFTTRLCAQADCGATFAPTLGTMWPLLCEEYWFYDGANLVAFAKFGLEGKEIEESRRYPGLTMKFVSFWLSMRYDLSKAEIMKSIDDFAQDTSA